jgi:ring-1,2-phenylacetyl-CoA epoxidase subunit PaaE
MELLQLRVLNIQPKANDAILVELEEKEGNAVEYEAGQFLTFVIVFHDKELRRSYSICSTPGVDKNLLVLIKRVENGIVSRHLIQNLKTGELLTALAPAGRFLIATRPENHRTVFFLAAGSGISAVYPLMKKLLKDEPLSRAILVYQNRDEASVIFKEELEGMQQQFKDRLLIVSLLSNPLDKNHLPQRLNNFLLEKLLDTYLDIHRDHDFYICGPAAFMRMIQFVLKVSGVKDEHIRKENFVIELMHPAPFVMDSAPRSVRIQWKKQVFEFEVRFPETILHAALAHHIPLPYSCRAGRCASCAIICVSGKVKMTINEVLTARDLREGLVLTCVGYAETDLLLQL